MIGKIGIAIGAICVTLIAVVISRTLSVGSPAVSNVPPAAKFDFDQKSAARRLAEAVRIRTVSSGINEPPQARAFRDFHALLARSFPKVHQTLKREIINEFSLLYTWPGKDPGLQPILLYAHMDTVPVAPKTEGQWTQPPFAGVIADGFIWGRGTMDMKVAVLGSLEAVEHLVGSDFSPKRTVYLAFGHDEELGGSNGAAKIAEYLASQNVQLEFTLDEGLVITHQIVPGVKKPAALIGIAEKGKVTLELVAKGKSGHSSMPSNDTAIGRLARAIQKLDAQPMPAILQGPGAELFAHLAPEMPFLTKLVLANRWLLDPVLTARLEAAPATNALIRTTMAPTIITGGIAANLLPESAAVSVDFRILPGDTINSVIEHVTSVVDDPKVTVRQIGSEPSQPSSVSDTGSDSFAAIRRSIAQVFPDVALAPGLVLGRTDSRRFSGITDQSYRFLPLRLGKPDLKRIHGTDERISIENYSEIIRFYAQLIINTAE